MKDKVIDNSLLHCIFYKQLVENEWSKLSNGEQGLEILRWRVLYWLAVWGKEFNNCTDCWLRLSSIKRTLSEKGIKLEFEPQIILK